MARQEGETDEGNSSATPMVRKEIKIGIDCVVIPNNKDSRRCLIIPHGEGTPSSLVFPNAALRESFIGRIRGIVAARAAAAGDALAGKLNPLQSEKLNIFTGTWNVGDTSPPAKPEELNQWVGCAIRAKFNFPERKKRLF